MRLSGTCSNAVELTSTPAPSYSASSSSIAALANNISSVAQYASLHFISFPTLVLSRTVLDEGALARFVEA